MLPKHFKICRYSFEFLPCLRLSRGVLRFQTGPCVYSELIPAPLGEGVKPWEELY